MQPKVTFRPVLTLDCLATYYSEKKVPQHWLHPVKRQKAPSLGASKMGGHLQYQQTAAKVDHHISSTNISRNNISLVHFPKLTAACQENSVILVQL
jgi:hypothetical protein